MNSQYLIILTMAAMVLVVFVFVAIWASRFVKVGPNQVLIVSGRQVCLPDGRIVGFRMVKGGGTFVFPVIEKAEVLSLEVFSIDMPKSKVPTAHGRPVELDCVAQVKIRGDDASILAAAEHLLSKSEGDRKNMVRLVLEKHLRAVLGSVSIEQVEQDPGACADRVQAAASEDLGKMGLDVVSFTIQEVRVG
jgi:flotillin